MNEEVRHCFRNNCQREIPGMGMYVFVTEGIRPGAQPGLVQCVEHPGERAGRNQYSREEFDRLTSR